MKIIGYLLTFVGGVLVYFIAREATGAALPAAGLTILIGAIYFAGLALIIIGEDRR